MRHILCFFLLSCVEFAPTFEREKFENEWWEIQEYPICFNFHESGDLLSYQPQQLKEREWRRFTDEGEWVFHTPNEYAVLDKSIFAYENEDCWDIEEYYDNKIITACNCTLLNIGE